MNWDYCDPHSFQTYVFIAFTAFLNKICFGKIYYFLEIFYRSGCSENDIFGIGIVTVLITNSIESNLGASRWWKCAVFAWKLSNMIFFKRVVKKSWFERNCRQSNHNPCFFNHGKNYLRCELYSNVCRSSQKSCV